MASRSPTPPVRRKPLCHKCNFPMAGHKKPDGRHPVCPGSAGLPTPTGSPGPPTTYRHTTPSPLRRQNAHRSPTPELPHPVPLPGGGWYIRNPNWVEHENPAPARAPTPAPSRISTLIIDDDQKTKASHPQWDEDNDEDDSISTTTEFMGRVVEDLKALDGATKSGGEWEAKYQKRRAVMMFATKRTDVGKTQQIAAREGMFAGLVKIPRATMRFDAAEDEAEEKKPGATALERARKALTRNGSWWMVIGRDSTTVKRVTDGAKDGVITPYIEEHDWMPGTVGDLKMEGPRLTTTLQLILTGMVASVITVILLSRL